MKGEKLIKRQNLIIGLVILFVGLIVAKNIYENQFRKISSLKDEIRQLEEKESILKEVQILEKKIEEYEEKFAKKDISSLIEELTKNAGICNLRVSFVRPEKEITRANFSEQPISIEVLGSYHNLGKFLSLLEKNAQIKVQEIESTKVEEKELRTTILISFIFLK